MRFKGLFIKIKQSKIYNLLKTIVTLGGNSKFAPSSLTFFIMVSLVPVITLIVYILSFFGYSATDLLDYIQKTLDLNNESMNLLELYFSNVPNISKILFGIGIFILVYISSKGITFFMFAYSKITNQPPKFNNFLSQKLWGIIISLILDLFLSVLIVFLVFFDNFSIIKNNDVLPIVISLILVFILFIFFIFLYSISSTVRPKFKDVFLGALISSLLISFGMGLYINYLDNISNASNYYGSLTGFILSLLIIYYSSYITLLGVQINTTKKELSSESPK